MRLHENMAETGTRLFRWRSYLLLVLVPLLVWELTQGPSIAQAYGARAGQLWSGLCILLVALGETVRMLTVSFVDPRTSGRNFKEQIASELNTTGLYTLTRNPLYFGNCLMYLGVVLYSQSLMLGLVLVLALIPYYERIIAAEERFLAGKFGAEFEDWCRKTPVFLPRLARWRRPARGFSLRMLVGREYTSVLGAVVALYLVNLGLARLGPVQGTIAPAWNLVLAVSAGLALCIYLLKTRTSVLRRR